MYIIIDNETGSWAEDRRAIDDVVYAFEKAFRAGTDPRVEDHLSGQGEARLDLLVELVHSDLELRFRAGREGGLESYLSRFPELAAAPGRLGGLFEAEIRLRERAGQVPGQEAYRALYAPMRVTVDEIFRRVGSRTPEVPGYEVVAEIACGGMGVVYHARQVALRREVALKLIRRDRLTADSLGDRFRGRFRREAEAVAALNHPSVVQVYETGEHDGDLFLAMELVNGPSLQKRLDSDGVLAPRAAAALVARAAAAIHAVHARGIVHRDLKPDNILIAPDGGPKLANFGLARPAEVTDGHTRQGTVIGTPEYMSPEQAAITGEEPTPRVDVYGLGAILYACLTGRAPFPRDSVLATLDRVRNQAVAPPRTIRPDCPRDLETICLKCLEKPHARRYQTAAELGDDLTRWLEGHPIRARRAGPAERAWKWARRHLPISAASTAALIAVAAGILFGVQALRANDLAKAQTQRVSRMFELGRVRQSYESTKVGDLRTARDRLRAVPADHRGWEWSHLDLLYASSQGREITRDATQAGLFEFVGPGNRYVMPIDELVIALRDTATGDEIRRFAMDRPIVRLALDAQSKVMAAVDDRGRLML